VAGNSQRQGAIRNADKKKKPTVGSGGNRRDALAGKGPTPKATERPGHVAKKREDAKSRAAAKEAERRPQKNRRRSVADGEVVAGRNPVVEALAAGVPALKLYVQRAVDSDPRIKQAMSGALTLGLPIAECSRDELSDLCDGVVHQGIALSVAPYEYTEFEDLLGLGTDRRPALLMALDGITDTRNLGAIVRSAVAFGGTGLVIPNRRSASVTAAAWRTSAGALAHMPVAQVTNLTRSIEAAKKAGFMTVGLAGESDMPIADADLGNEPVMLVIGSEGKGLGRLVAETCDYRVGIPITDRVESLNASVAAGIALYSVVAGRSR